MAFSGQCKIHYQVVTHAVVYLTLGSFKVLIIASLQCISQPRVNIMCVWHTAKLQDRGVRYTTELYDFSNVFLLFYKNQNCLRVPLMGPGKCI